MKPPIPNSYWLIPDRVVCGEYPLDFDHCENEEGMAAILKAGVRSFVNLTQEGELPLYDDLAKSTAGGLDIDPDSLEFHRHSIPDGKVPETREAMSSILATIHESLAQDKPVYIHCYGGRGRTGTVGGCLISEIESCDGATALARLVERWQANANSEYSESPESEEQRDFIRNWPDKDKWLIPQRSLDRQ